MYAQGHRRPNPRPSSGAAKSQHHTPEALVTRGTGQTLLENSLVLAFPDASLGDLTLS